MKKIFLFAFLIISISCSNNENNDPNGNGNDNDVVPVSDGNGNSGCNKPDGLYVDNITTTSVITNWGDPNGSQLFNVEYGARGFTVGNGTRVSSSQTSKALTGLSSGTEYDFYVRANCGGSTYSNWAGPHSFVTN